MYVNKMLRMVYIYMQFLLPILISLLLHVCISMYIDCVTGVHIRQISQSPNIFPSSANATSATPPPTTTNSNNNSNNNSRSNSNNNSNRNSMKSTSIQATADADNPDLNTPNPSPPPIPTTTTTTLIISSCSKDAILKITDIQLGGGHNYYPYNSDPLTQSTMFCHKVRRTFSTASHSPFSACILTGKGVIVRIFVYMKYIYLYTYIQYSYIL